MHVLVQDCIEVASKSYDQGVQNVKEKDDLETVGGIEQKELYRSESQDAES